MHAVLVAVGAVLLLVARALFGRLLSTETLAQERPAPLTRPPRAPARPRAREGLRARGLPPRGIPQPCEDATMQAQTQTPPTMHAVLIRQFGGPDVVELADVPLPERKAGELL